MKTITATELARNLRQVLDRLSKEGEEIVIERNHRQGARLVPDHQSALEAMGDLHRTLAPESAERWLEESRQKPMDQRAEKATRDPWAS